MYRKEERRRREGRGTRRRKHREAAEAGLGHEMRRRFLGVEVTVQTVPLQAGSEETNTH